jgi:hypothetical protein
MINWMVAGMVRLSNETIENPNLLLQYINMVK